MAEASVRYLYVHWGSNPGLCKLGENRKEGGYRSCPSLHLVRRQQVQINYIANDACMMHVIYIRMHVGPGN